MRAIIPYLLCLLAAAPAACSSNDDTTTTAAAELQGQARTVRELASGGARLRGGGVRMDVQVGRPLAHVPMQTNATLARPAAAVTP